MSRHRGAKRLRRYELLESSSLLSMAYTLSREREPFPHGTPGSLWPTLSLFDSRYHSWHAYTIRSRAEFSLSSTFAHLPYSLGGYQPQINYHSQCHGPPDDDRVGRLGFLQKKECYSKGARGLTVLAVGTPALHGEFNFTGYMSESAGQSFTPIRAGGTLLPKLRVHFASSFDHCSLSYLRISTCYLCRFWGVGSVHREESPSNSKFFLEVFNIVDYDNSRDYNRLATMEGRGNIACHKSEARFGTLLREGRLASRAFRDEAFWRSQVNFGPPNPATDEKALWYGVKGSVYVVTLPAFQRCLEDGPDAAERRPGSGFPTGGGGQETAISRHITTYRQHRRDLGRQPDWE
ncbi:hypothetical protein Tco_0857451 [Tanacetum coccineum]|uniref:Uncharacterized protein n=1 Tax=Tanacetum coccineum TaxID=301880 RepID=A0ABQ5BAI7_9ASTR